MSCARPSRGSERMCGRMVDLGRSQVRDAARAQIAASAASVEESTQLAREIRRKSPARGLPAVTPEAPARDLTGEFAAYADAVADAAASIEPNEPSKR